MLLLNLFILLFKELSVHSHSSGVPKEKLLKEKKISQMKDVAPTSFYLVHKTFLLSYLRILKIPQDYYSV